MESESVLYYNHIYEISDYTYSKVFLYVLQMVQFPSRVKRFIP